MAKAIQLLDLPGQYAEIQAELAPVLEAVVASGEFILGPQVAAFEAELAAYLGVPAAQAVSCANGSDALLLALLALDIQPGDEVITTPFTFVATASCIARAGARIVFADIDAQLNISPARIADAITPRTKAVISVDLYGCPCDQLAIRALCKKHGLWHISDSAQSLGATIGPHKVGTLADFTTFSFFPSKNLGCFGDGGLVVCKSPRHARTLRQLRTHGSRPGNKYHYARVGMNSRLDALQAAVLRVKLRWLDRWLARRRTIAGMYAADLRTVTHPQKAAGHAYHQYTVVTDRRNALQKHLAATGISSTVYYPRPLHLQACFKYLGYTLGAFPQAEAASARVLSLPVHDQLSGRECARVIRAINSF